MPISKALQRQARARRARLSAIFGCLRAALAAGARLGRAAPRLLAIGLAGVCAWAPGPARAETERPPNIVLILADDLGHADIGVNGGALVPTPNIDSIARDGARFTHAYAASPVCAVSRAGLLTGRHPARIGVEHNPITPAFAKALADRGADGPHPGRLLPTPSEGVPPTPQQGLPPAEVTIAERLQQAGYATGAFGKWHLGAADGMRPEQQGFDEHIGFYGGAALYAPKDAPGIVRHELTWSSIDTFTNARLRADLVRNGEPLAAEGYMTDTLAREAASFIRRHADRPFFAYVPFFAPHTPIEVPQATYDRLSAIADPTERAYAALVASLDEAVGQVLRAIDEAGLRDRTIVIFSSDNGGADYLGLRGVNAPLRGWKATFLEGGVRVPMLVRWPGRIEAGMVRSWPVSHLDLAPTLARLAGAPALQDGDGRDLSRTWLQDVRPRSQPLFWRSGHYRAVRDGRYKLITAEDPPSVRLFDIEADPSESVDLSKERPRIVRRLQRLLAEQETRYVTPLWPSLVRLPVYYDYTEREEPPADAEFVYWGG